MKKNETISIFIILLLGTAVLVKQKYQETLQLLTNS
jgi:hypothetical protein